MRLLVVSSCFVNLIPDFNCAFWFGSHQLFAEFLVDICCRFIKCVLKLGLLFV